MFKGVFCVLCFVLFIAGSLASTTVCISNEDFCTGCSSTYIVPKGRSILVNVSNSSIQFCSATLTDVIVTFTNSSNLMIGSTVSKTRIMHSGFHLINVHNISICCIEFIDCGKAFSSAYSDDIAFAAVLIEDSIAVTVRNVSFLNSSGSGLIMLNIGGTSMLTNTIFRNSTTTNANTTTSQSFVYTGALHIEMSTCGWSTLMETTTVCEKANVIQNSTLFISECDFIDNHATGKVQGGGLFIEITGKSAGNHVTIKDCHFINNSAFRGGGACIRLDQDVLNNIVEVSHSVFILNGSPSIGGGLAVGYAFNQSRPRKNNVIFHDCKFQRNKAEIHAGLSIYSSSSPDRLISENSIQFRNCSWTRNSATSLGAAVGVVALYNRNSDNNIIINQWFVEIVFENATFQSNYFTDDDLGSSGGVRSGIMHITTIPVKFEGDVTFDSNSGTAVEVVSSTLNIQYGAQVTFENNLASPNGAALNLIHTAAVAVSKGCKLTFNNNTACSGAAIKQHTIDPYDFIHSRKCFIKFIDSALANSQQRKPNLVFTNNTATCEGFGNSIHLTSVRPCNYTYRIGVNKCQPIFTNKSIFNCAASFEFHGTLNGTEITTDAKQIVLSSDNFVTAIPGKEVNLPISAVDELNNVLPVVYTVTVSRGNITLDRAYKYITYSKSRFYGKPGSQGTIHITANSARNQVEAYLKITLSQCPPGLILDDKNHACKCSTLAKDSQRYTPITECDEALNTAILAQNWWMNMDDRYENKSLDVEDQLLYGQCPENHCFNHKSTRYLKLSNESIAQVDDNFLCHSARTGRLCSQCRDGFTTHYHSSVYVCGNKSTCKFGWFLYVVSELLPVTSLLLFIILFDIKLTTGVINGFIYFAQTIDKIVLDDTSNYFASLKVTKIFLDGYALIIRMFNLNFFQINATSFCLWDNAKTLDMISFRYVTTIYSLLLVFFIVAIAHYCNAKRFKRVISKVRYKRLTARSTVIHGLTGFLVLSYSGFTSTSVKLLLSVSLYSKGHVLKYTAAYYNGELTYLTGNHLYYAVPAIFIFATLGIIPPLLLISYPLCYKILSFLKLNESKFSHHLCTYIPLEKMKPLFDSFQSSFKDKYRYFSGLYFIFRLSTSAIQAALANTAYFFPVISIQSALIFALHAMCRPFKSNQHNILEGVFLFDISIIAMTFSIISDHYRGVGILLGIQLVLLYLPLLIMAAYTVRKNCQKVGKFKYFVRLNRSKETSEQYHEFNDSVLFREAENRLANK